MTTSDINTHTAAKPVTFLWANCPACGTSCLAANCCKGAAGTDIEGLLVCPYCRSRYADSVMKLEEIVYENPTVQ